MMSTVNKSQIERLRQIIDTTQIVCYPSTHTLTHTQTHNNRAIVSTFRNEKEKPNINFALDARTRAPGRTCLFTSVCVHFVHKCSSSSSLTASSRFPSARTLARALRRRPILSRIVRVRISCNIYDLMQIPHHHYRGVGACPR